MRGRDISDTTCPRKQEMGSGESAEIESHTSSSLEGTAPPSPSGGSEIKGSSYDMEMLPLKILAVTGGSDNNDVKPPDGLLNLSDSTSNSSSSSSVVEVSPAEAANSSATANFMTSQSGKDNQYRRVKRKIAMAANWSMTTRSGAQLMNPDQKLLSGNEPRFLRRREQISPNGSGGSRISPVSKFGGKPHSMLVNSSKSWNNSNSGGVTTSNKHTWIDSPTNKFHSPKSSGSWTKGVGRWQGRSATVSSSGDPLNVRQDTKTTEETVTSFSQENCVKRQLKGGYGRLHGVRAKKLKFDPPVSDADTVPVVSDVSVITASCPTVSEGGSSCIVDAVSDSTAMIKAAAKIDHAYAEVSKETDTCKVTSDQDLCEPKHLSHRKRMPLKRDMKHLLEFSVKSRLLSQLREEQRQQISVKKMIHNRTQRLLKSEREYNSIIQTLCNQSKPLRMKKPVCYKVKRNIKRYAHKTTSPSSTNPPLSVKPENESSRVPTETIDKSLAEKTDKSSPKTDTLPPSLTKKTDASSSFLKKNTDASSPLLAEKKKADRGKLAMEIKKNITAEAASAAKVEPDVKKKPVKKSSTIENESEKNRKPLVAMTASLSPSLEKAVTGPTTPDPVVMISRVSVPPKAEVTCSDLTSCTTDSAAEKVQIPRKTVKRAYTSLVRLSRNGNPLGRPRKTKISIQNHMKITQAQMQRLHSQPSALIEQERNSDNDLKWRPRGEEIMQVDPARMEQSSKVKLFYSLPSSENSPLLKTPRIVLPHILPKLDGASGSQCVPKRSSIRQTECALRFREIAVKKQDSFIQIVLTSNTRVRNGLNFQVMQEITTVLSLAKTDAKCNLVVLNGTGSVFCSGVDLIALSVAQSNAVAEKMASAIKDFCKTLSAFPKPLVAAVNGAAVGLGVTILPFFDLVYASDKATFYTPYRKLGQIPEGGATMTLPSMMGHAKANALLLEGRKLTAIEAHDVGLVTQVLWPATFMEEVIPKVQDMAKSSSQAMETSKAISRFHSFGPLQVTLDTEFRILCQQWSSSDWRMTIKRFLQREEVV